MEDREDTLGRAATLFNRLARTLRMGLLVRLLGTPFQRVLDNKGATHGWLTEKGHEILLADGHGDAAEFLEPFISEIVKGNYWADLYWMNSTHHYNPETKRGLWIWPNAAFQIRTWYNLAISLWDGGRKDKALFMLGACVHIIQDMCQPYHSTSTPFRGHQKYEKWADLHKHELEGPVAGLYDLSPTPEGWVVENAEFSHGFFGAVTDGSMEAKKEATAILLDRAMATTAGFLHYFWERVTSPPLPDPHGPCRAPTP